MKKYLLALLSAVFMVFIFPSAVFALPPLIPVPDAPAGETLASVQLSASTVTFLVATVIPILVGLLTKLESKRKGVLMILLTAINAAIVTATLADGTAIFSQQTFQTFITGLVGAYGSYYGLLKPRGITSSAVAVPGRGDGASVMVPGALASRGVS